MVYCLCLFNVISINKIYLQIFQIGTNENVLNSEEEKKIKCRLQYFGKNWQIWFLDSYL